MQESILTVRSIHRSKIFGEGAEIERERRLWPHKPKKERPSFGSASSRQEWGGDM
jgi:hypothetical protein